MKLKARRQNNEETIQSTEQLEITIEESPSAEGERRRNVNVFEFSNNVVGVLQEMTGFVEVSERARPLNIIDMVMLSSGKREPNQNMEKFKSNFAQIVKKSLKQYSLQQAVTIQALHDKMLKQIQQNVLHRNSIQQYSNPQSQQILPKFPNDNTFSDQYHHHEILKQSLDAAYPNNYHITVQQTTLR